MAEDFKRENIEHTATDLDFLKWDLVSNHKAYPVT